MAKSLKAALSVCFCAAIAATGLTLLIRKPRLYSENENRYLQQRPKLSAADIADGTWQNDITDYMSDQMPFRDTWTAMQAKTQLLLGKKDIGGVYIGKEGHYFEKITDDDLSRLRYQSNLDAVAAAAKFEPTVPFSVMFVPSAGTIQTQYLPDHAELYDAENLYALAQYSLQDSCTLVDCSEGLKAHKDEEIYYRTDHHWTTYGAWFGYQAFMESQGMTAKPFEQMNVHPISTSFYGTLYSKVLDADIIPDTVSLRYQPPQCSVTIDGQEAALYDMDALNAKDHYEVFFGGNFGEIRIQTQSSGGKSLLIFKDSYANCFVPYLLDDYSTITMIDLRYSDGSWKDRLLEQPDQVLFLYEISNFAQDANISAMAAALQTQ